MTPMYVTSVWILQNDLVSNIHQRDCKENHHVYEVMMHRSWFIAVEHFHFGKAHGPESRDLMSHHLIEKARHPLFRFGLARFSCLKESCSLIVFWCIQMSGDTFRDPRYGIVCIAHCIHLTRAPFGQKI